MSNFLSDCGSNVTTSFCIKPIDNFSNLLVIIGMFIIVLCFYFVAWKFLDKDFLRTKK